MEHRHRHLVPEEYKIKESCTELPHARQRADTLPCNTHEVCIFILPTLQIRKRRLAVFSKCPQALTTGQRWSRDLQPGVSAYKQTHCTQERASGQPSAPDRTTNSHKPLIEDWKIVMLPVLVRILNTRENQCLGQDKVPIAKETKKCKETQKYTQENARAHTHAHTHTQLKISSRNPCFFL